MGNIKTKAHYKTKGVIDIFLWHIENLELNKAKCADIKKIPEEFEGDFIEKEAYEKKFKIPFELVETDGKVEIVNLQIMLLLISQEEQGSRIDFFKVLTNDPEQLIHYFRWKYELIYSRIPKYLISISFMHPKLGKTFLKTKQHKILDVSNLRYMQFTTSSVNILKLTMLKK
ncbi:hypothetical protein SteCoe_11231 [Stentor coeruleus]|uniref:Uncharacterized protein n=1 Tax=Stentor coeruleus TaxID=5963 RepID=A0A1R2CDK4_9CILI|nr:hypothetical protein SteCoe_11231 [Stentor coeruleus]